MADNNKAEGRQLEEAAADRRRLEAEKARARVEMQRSGSGEAMGRYQAATADLDNARNRERITRQEIEESLSTMGDASPFATCNLFGETKERCLRVVSDLERAVSGRS